MCALVRDRTKIINIFCLFVVLSSGLYLRYKAANHEYISQWDEAYHALVAKNFISHPLTPALYDNPIREYNYKNWNSNHVWLHKPPAALWIGQNFFHMWLLLFLLCYYWLVIQFRRYYYPGKRCFQVEATY